MTWTSRTMTQVRNSWIRHDATEEFSDLEPDEFEDVEDWLHRRWRKEVKPSVVAHYGPDDRPARAESFSNWLDDLNRCGEVSDSIAYHVDQPEEN